MPNYAIMRMEKRKLSSVGRICKHHERLKAEYKSNPDIDPERAGMNYHIIQAPGPYRDMGLARIEQAGARRRKDSVVMQDCFVGGTPDWLKEKSYKEQREYFNHAYQFFERNFGKENIISAVVHMDEDTPHMHLCFVPITAKGRLSSKDINTTLDTAIRIAEGLGLPLDSLVGDGRLAEKLDVIQYLLRSIDWFQALSGSEQEEVILHFRRILEVIQK